MYVKTAAKARLLCFVCMVVDGTTRDKDHGGPHGTAANAMLSDQGAAVVMGGGLRCSDCKVQQPAANMLNGAGQCAGCAS